MISVPLAKRLRDAGLRWQPASGDRFVVPDRGMDGEIFTVSDMTVDVHDFPSGTVIGFNGTTEWALDSVRLGDALWLPNEAQLRERLGATFRRLELVDGSYRVAVEVNGRPWSVDSVSAPEAYGLALLHLVTGE